jgi:maltose alpha-D-glucosyltransferase/alpha-amylase
MKPPEWLSSAVFYQIYPQSFSDSNQDGIGDLPGIVGKLDYIRSLGVNALWLNPVFDSPFGDAGYDVRDFKKVAPRYGTNADLKKLFREAHKRGMKVLLDLVAGHTSIEHPWFEASRQHKPNARSDSYVWTPTVWTNAPDGKWINGPGPRDGNVLTNFFWFQPALNYGYASPHPDRPWEQSPDAPGPAAVRAELRSIMKHWLDAGCDGFRVDMASSLIKGPPDSVPLRDLWQEFRGWMEQDYPHAILVSEWSHPKQAIHAGFHIDFMIHFGEPAYNALFGTWCPVKGDARDPHVFFERAGGGNICAFTENYLDHYRATRGRGYIALPTGNHDYPRLKRGRSDAELRCAHGMLFTMPGIPFLYYGDEIGMDYLEDVPPTEGSFAFRTGTRTPMQWTPGRNKGFSSAPARSLYLPVDTRPGAPDVASQENDPHSHLHFVRRLLALRAQSPALGNNGDFRVVYAEKNQYPFVYERFSGDEHWLVVLNPRSKSASATHLDLPAKATYSPVEGQGVRLKQKDGVWSVQCDGISWTLFRRN